MWAGWVLVCTMQRLCSLRMGLCGVGWCGGVVFATQGKALWVGVGWWCGGVVWWCGGVVCATQGKALWVGVGLWCGGVV